jgi:hypothetical protein
MNELDSILRITLKIGQTDVPTVEPFNITSVVRVIGLVVVPLDFVPNHGRSSSCFKVSHMRPLEDGLVMIDLDDLWDGHLERDGIGHDC